MVGTFQLFHLKVSAEQSSTVIIVPKNKFNEGWENLAGRIEDFINKFSSTQSAFITTGESRKPFTGKGTT